MNQSFSLALAGGLALLGCAAHAAPSVTEPAEWNLSGKMKGKAHLTCHDPAPSPAEPVEQAIPVAIGTPNWVAKAQFAADGGFQYWEADAALKDQPLTKWASYKGSWAQHGARVVVTLDGKSAAALIATVDGASKCASGSSATGPCFDTKGHRFTGTVKTTRDGTTQLRLKEKVRLGVKSIRAKGQYHCGGAWHYNKSFNSN